MGTNAPIFKAFFLQKQHVTWAETKGLFSLLSAILMVAHRWCLEGEQESGQAQNSTPLKPPSLRHLTGQTF